MQSGQRLGSYIRKSSDANVGAWRLLNSSACDLQPDSRRLANVTSFCRKHLRPRCNVVDEASLTCLYIMLLRCNSQPCGAK